MLEEQRTMLPITMSRWLRVALVPLLLCTPALRAEGLGLSSKGLCERVFASLGQVQTSPAVLDKLDELENIFLVLQSEFPATALEPIRQDLNEVTSRALASESTDTLRAHVRRIVREMIALYTKVADEKAAAQQPSLVSVMTNVTAISPEETYRVSEQWLARFETSVVIGLDELNPASAVKLMRAFKKGFVAPGESEGLHADPTIHPTVFAVSYRGADGDQLVGCRDGKILHIRKVVLARSEEAHRGLHAFKALCN